jgi:capsular polysaccharide biosynthesis protein
MEFNDLIKSKKQTLVSFFLVFFLLGAIFTGLQTFKYTASSKLLVIQEGASGVDPFAVSRSVEYLSGLFSQVVSSNSFFNLIKESGFNVDQSYFKGDSIKQMKLWQKTVFAKSVEASGVINISVYHPSSYQAKQIALAVNHVLMTQNSNYQGIGSSVKITVMDDPLVSNYPNQPNLLVNFGLVVALSLIFGLAYIYIFPEEKYNIRLFHRRGQKLKATKGAIKHDFLTSVERETEADESLENRGNIKNIMR